MSSTFSKSGLGKALFSGLLLMMMVMPAQETEAANPIAATELTQLANNVELIAILGKEAEQLLELIKTYKLAEKQAQLLPDLMRRNVVTALLNLARSTKLGMAISYASADVTGDLEEVFKSVENYENFLRTASIDEKSARHMEVIQSTYDTVKGALENAGLQADMFEDEEGAMWTMLGMLEGAEGTNQILQAGFSIGQAQVEQMQKLRQLVMGQSNMQGAAIAAEMDDKAKHEAMLKRSKQQSFDIDPSTAAPITIDSLF